MSGGMCHGSERVPERTAPRRHPATRVSEDDRRLASSAAVLSLQRRVGNHAVGTLLHDRPSVRTLPHHTVVQRCGSVDPEVCSCHPPDVVSQDRAHGTPVRPVQPHNADDDSVDQEPPPKAQPGKQPGAGHADTLEEIPVAGSMETLQRACGSVAIGNPSGCTPATTEPPGETTLYRTNCDDFSTPDQQRVVEDFADSMLPTDTVNVHGFASIDGPGTFNQRLSCARALKAVGILLSKGVASSQIRIFSHGATPGNAALRRSVVLERDPPISRRVVPQLSATVVTAPTPGNCGGMNFVIQWNLSRNSAPRGGFIIQAVNFVWNVVDCTGTAVPNPDPRTSPLRYFEAWRVAPNSQNLSPVSTDTFFWPDVSPWGGGCTDGVVSIVGVAQYHDDVATLPSHMVANNPATFAGILQSSLSDPSLGGAISAPFDHRLAFHWVCCPCSSSLTVVDDHVP